MKLIPLPLLICSLLLVVAPLSAAASDDLPDPVKSLAALTDSLADAEALYQAGAYVRAAESYRRLMETTDDSDTRRRGLLRLGDCAFLGGPMGDEWADAFYAQVLDQGYSPYLAEAYRKWRAAMQALWHGVSNFSDIPTEEYQTRKQQTLEVIAAHLRTFPDDPTALAQQDALRQLPDFQRGGPMGSSVLNEMALLWSEGAGTLDDPL